VSTEDHHDQILDVQDNEMGKLSKLVMHIVSTNYKDPQKTCQGIYQLPEETGKFQNKLVKGML